MFSPVEALNSDGVLMLSYTGMVYVLSCRGFLDVILVTQGWCMFSLVEAFLLLSYTGMVYVLPVEAFLMLSYTGMVYVLSCRGFLVVIVHRDGVCSLL